MYPLWQARRRWVTIKQEYLAIDASNRVVVKQRDGSGRRCCRASHKHSPYVFHGVFVFYQNNCPDSLQSGSSVARQK